MIDINERLIVSLFIGTVMGTAVAALAQIRFTLSDFSGRTVAYSYPAAPRAVRAGVITFSSAVAPTVAGRVSTRRMNRMK